LTHPGGFGDLIHGRRTRAAAHRNPTVRRAVAGHFPRAAWMLTKRNTWRGNAPQRKSRILLGFVQSAKMRRRRKRTYKRTTARPAKFPQVTQPQRVNIRATCFRNHGGTESVLPESTPLN
jgi:hypothetical protein